MTHIELKKPYKLLPKYAGMRPRDEVIWDQYVENNPDAFTWVMYNVHVGDPVADEQYRHAMVANGAFEVGQWCVDVLAFDGTKEYIIEVKPSAGASAIGQVLSYLKILQHEGRVSMQAVPVILTDNISPITELACKLLGVHILIP